MQCACLQSRENPPNPLFQRGNLTTLPAKQIKTGYACAQHAFLLGYLACTAGAD
jgi:hypothetical protein